VDDVPDATIDPVELVPPLGGLGLFPDVVWVVIDLEARLDLAPPRAQ
jgi:hypothetical protein